MNGSRPRGNVEYNCAGRVVIVTGGASGIGDAICRAFSAATAKVIAVDVSEPASGESQIDYRRIDVSDQSQCAEVVQSVVADYGGIDVLINNAAIQPAESYKPIDELSADVWQRMIQINLCGYLHMAKHVVPVMKRQQSGVIINMASAQAHRTAREVGIYSPIKAANMMQAKQWALEYARDGIRAVSVSPGAINTPLVQASLEAQGGGEALANRHPIGRIGAPEEVARAVVWLSTADASFITGTDLAVDGGLGAFGAFAEPYQSNGS